VGDGDELPVVIGGGLERLDLGIDERHGNSSVDESIDGQRMPGIVIDIIDCFYRFDRLCISQAAAGAQP
jgi:hypothetical protein